jgi:adenylate cyclase
LEADCPQPKKKLEREKLISNFFSELRRRRVIRVIVLYAIAGWIVIEVTATVLPGLNLPDWTTTLVILLVALGFVIAIMLAWAFDIGPGGIHRTSAASSEEADSQPAQPAALSKAPAVAAKLQTEIDERKSIAVLPFLNMSGDAENEYFSDGIAEEILNLLVKLPKLKVASRTSSFVFKGKEANIPTVAAELGVNTVLEGSVRRAGDRVRITAQLIEAKTDSHLWSETYDREMKDVFAIQDDIAQSIVTALQMTLTPKDRRALQYVATSNPEAYDYYLKGRKYMYSMSSRNFQHALRMYHKAIELDSNYAIAYAGMADTYSQMYRFVDASPENTAKALEASAHAVELDPDSAEAHASRGLSLFINEKYEEAERHFETAGLLNPKLFESYFFYALSCSSQGQHEKAARLFMQASEVNPADYQCRSFLALAYQALGRTGDAIKARRRAVELIEHHLDLNPDDTRALYVGASNLSFLGDSQRAIEWASRAYDAGADEPMVLYNVACTYALLGESEQALELLEKAVDLGWGDRAWLETDSDLDSLRDIPRFKFLLKRIR